MTTGSVIVLNGPSSAGKTTLAAALQRRFAVDDECWFVYAMDDYFAKIPSTGSPRSEARLVPA